MNPIRSPRLLPWSGADGKPCYLIGDGTGRLSRLADQIEAVQLGLARQILERAHDTLTGERPSPEDARPGRSPRRRPARRPSHRRVPRHLRRRRDAMKACIGVQGCARAAA